MACASGCESNSNAFILREEFDAIKKEIINFGQMWRLAYALRNGCIDVVSVKI
jgi:hypothetical protein